MEIERKFLLSNLDCLKGKHVKTFKINQGYLFNKEGTQLRIRLTKDDKDNELGYVTVKSKSSRGELVRNEYEMEVSADIAKTLLKDCPNFGIRKVRYIIKETINNKSYRVEIDKFKGINSGLLLAEIEFDSEKEAHKFKPTNLPYLEKEVTDDPKYKNDYLSKKPYGLW